MAIIAAVCLAQVLLLLIYLLFARVYFLLSIIFFLLYFILKYYDGDERTGHRSWSFLRNYTLFGKSTVYLMGNAKAFDADQSHRRLLFVVMGNVTNMGLIHGFGMHGGVFRHIDLVYMLPAILFRVPILRDLLLWSGAVIHDETLLLRLLERGKSVVYCPSRMDDIFSATDPRSDDQMTLKPPGVDVFEFSMKHKIPLVPVLVTNETRRYAILGGAWVKAVQRYCYARVGWPFPLAFGPRIFGRKPPPKLEIQIGCPLEAGGHTSAESYKELFMGQFTGVV